MWKISGKSTKLAFLGREAILRDKEFMDDILKIKYMKTNNFTFFFFLAFFFFFCASTVMAKGQEESSTANGSTDSSMGITARGSVGQREVTPSDPMYTGNGGSNIRLAVLAPEVQGDVPVYLPLYIQGLLNNNINKYSAINLIDRQNLNKIINEQNLAASGIFSDKDFINIGNLTNAQYFLFGTVQKLSGNRYSLQLSVTEASTGVRKASFMKDGTSAQFEGNGAILNEATAELLEQLGIQLTAVGKQALLAGNISTVQAETGLARGITAQAGGADVQALFNFAQAITFDPSQFEAISHLNTLSTSISGGTISQRIVNDIQARDRWLEVFKETAKFFNDHPPFEIIFDPSLIQIGETDFVKRTANLGMNITLEPSNAGFSAINTLLEGLEKTGRRSQWGFPNWPLTDITPKTAGTVLFNDTQSFNCKVDVSLLNEKNKPLGSGSITLNTGTIKFSLLDKTIMVPNSVKGTVNFLNIKAEDLTPSLTIIITAVNGIQARTLNTYGYMKIETGEVFIDNPQGHSYMVDSVAFSPDGKQILSSDDNTIKLWDASTGREIITFISPDILNSVAFSPDGREVLSGGVNYDKGRSKIVRLWDMATSREIRTFSGYSNGKFSPDGRQVVSRDENNTIKLWDVVTGREIRTFLGHSSGVWSVVFSPDGKQILSSSYDKTIKLWDAATGREIRTFLGHSHVVSSVAFSPDGRKIVSGSSDKTVKLWDATTGREIRTFSGHLDSVASVAFSPDGKHILSSSWDETIKLWDIVTGREIKTFFGHSDVPISVVFSINGRQFLSGAYDGTIKLWDAVTGRLLYTIGTPQNLRHEYFRGDW